MAPESMAFFYVEVLRIITSHEPDLDYFSTQLDLNVDDRKHSTASSELAINRRP